MEPGCATLREPKASEAPVGLLLALCVVVPGPAVVSSEPPRSRVSLPVDPPRLQEVATKIKARNNVMPTLSFLVTGAISSLRVPLVACSLLLRFLLCISRRSRPRRGSHSGTHGKQGSQYHKKVRRYFQEASAQKVLKPSHVRRPIGATKT